MIKPYKILSGKYDLAAIPNLTTYSNNYRGSDLRLQKNRARYDLRNFFTNRIVNIWNSLPNDVVHADCTNT